MPDLDPPTMTAAEDYAANGHRRLTPAERDAEDLAHARRAAAEAGVPFDRYAFARKQWRDQLEQAGHTLLRRVKVNDPFAAGITLDRLLTGGVWLDGPWRCYVTSGQGYRLWLSDAGVVVREDDVQARQVARTGTGPTAEAWATYAALLRAEPSPDCAGSGFVLDPTVVEEAAMITAGEGWCFECESGVPVVLNDGDRAVLAPHDATGRLLD